MSKMRRNEAELNRLDEQVLSFIHSYQLCHGFTPSRAEISKALKLSNLMVAQRSIDRLREQNKFNEQEAPQPPSIANIPLLGNVAAGRPIEAIEQAINIPVPALMIKGAQPHFVLRVKGNSMIDDHICDGDYVLIRQQASAENGEKVVALIDNEATLKRFYKKQNRVELHPANETMKPIIVEAHQHLRIAGVYVGLIRMGV